MSYLNSTTIIGFVGADPEQRPARNNGSKFTAKGKKSKGAKITSWSIRADVVRKLGRGAPEPDAPASAPVPASDEASF